VFPGNGGNVFTAGTCSGENGFPGSTGNVFTPGTCSGGGVYVVGMIKAGMCSPYYNIIYVYNYIIIVIYMYNIIYI
jgi:hypothetical protein